jgi:hypothetical protein
MKSRYWKQRDPIYDGDVAPIPTPQAPFKHCVAGIHVGRMEPFPLAGEFDVVLSVAAEAGAVDDGISHQHMPISYIHPDQFMLLTAAGRVAAWVDGDKRVLIRSEGGRNRPGSIVALAVLELGGNALDAFNAVDNHGISLISDFRYRNIVRDQADAKRKRRPM